MNDYKKRIIDDLPQQFKERKRIEELIEVIVEQFQDLAEFYDELKNGRSMTTAQGAQLDRIGQIMAMTRRDAMEFLKLPQMPSDDQYRIALKYKSKLNFAVGTYKDVIDQLKIINGDTLGFSFRESPDYPATVILETEDGANSEKISTMASTPIKLSGGVGLRLRSNEKEDINIVVGITSQVVEFLTETMVPNT